MLLLAEVSGIVACESGILASMYTLYAWEWHVNASSICQRLHAVFVINLNLHMHDQTEQNIHPFMIKKFPHLLCSVYEFTLSSPRGHEFKVYIV